MALGPHCLDLAREALEGYTLVGENQRASREEWLATRIRIGIEDDISDLVRGGKITKKEALCSEASAPPVPAAGAGLGANSGEAGAAIFPPKPQEPPNLLVNSWTGKTRPVPA